MKLYEQQIGQLKDSNQGADFVFGKNDNCHQVGNGYLEVDLTLRKNGKKFIKVDGAGYIDETIKLMNIDFVYAFIIATLSTTGGKEIEQNKQIGYVSTIMRLLTRKDGDLLSYFSS